MTLTEADTSPAAVRTPLRVGIFGGLSNLGYSLGKILRKRGMNVQLIHDPHENFAFSQPLWDDCDVVLDAQTLRDPNTNQGFWDRKAIEVGWNKPDWVTYVSERGRRVALTKPALALRAVLNAGTSPGAMKFALGGLHLSGPLSEFDFLVLFGVGPVYGYFAGLPYVIIPSGADIRDVPFENNLLGRMQRAAYAGARRILINSWQYADYLRKLDLSDRWTYFPFPIDTDKYANRSSRNQDRLFELLPTHVRGKFVFFMPSAHEFSAKGTDRALSAFLRLSRERNDMVLVTPSWGTDTAEARQIVRDADGEEEVVFVPYLVSRPLLADFYRASNVILDQFVHGEYGLSTLEAMACERAVLSHIDHAKYRPYLRTLPPNLQAHTEQEIYNQMKWAVENPDALMALGRKSREWVIDQHSAESVRILEQVMTHWT